MLTNARLTDAVAAVARVSGSVPDGPAIPMGDDGFSRAMDVRPGAARAAAAAVHALGARTFSEGRNSLTVTVGPDLLTLRTTLPFEIAAQAVADVAVDWDARLPGGLESCVQYHVNDVVECVSIPDAVAGADPDGRQIDPHLQLARAARARVVNAPFASPYGAQSGPAQVLTALLLDLHASSRNGWYSYTRLDAMCGNVMRSLMEGQSLVRTARAVDRDHAPLSAAPPLARPARTDGLGSRGV